MWTELLYPLPQPGKMGFKELPVHLQGVQERSLHCQISTEADDIKVRTGGYQIFLQVFKVQLGQFICKHLAKAVSILADNDCYYEI